MEENLMQQIEMIVNCGNDDYFLIKENFACTLFKHPVQPIQMLYFYTLPKKFRYDELSRELIYGVKRMPVEVYKDSIDSIIDKMRDISNKLDRIFVCPCSITDDAKKKITDALSIICKNASFCECPLNPNNNEV